MLKDRTRLSPANKGTQAELERGTEVWFLKSMRLCRVVERHDDGNYTLEALDGSKQLLATPAGVRIPTRRELEEMAGTA